MKDINNFLISISVFVLAVTAAMYIERLMNIPQCYEDAVLVGIGDFEDGRWDSYICGPSVDDFEGYYD